MSGQGERGLAVAYLRHLATLRPADAHGLRVAASDIEAAFHLDPQLNPEAALESDDVIVAPAMETLTSAFVVKRPDGEMAPPTIGQHGGMSLGAFHMEGVGAVMAIAVHHPVGDTLICSFGWEGYSEFCHAMNRWGTRINSGEFNRPPVAS